MNYYTVKIAVVEPDPKGRDKKRTIKLLIENAYSVTEVEAKVQEYFLGYGGTDYTIKNVTQIDFNDKMTCGDK